MKIELEKMTWPEAAERAKEDPYTPVVVLFSSTEQHGRHSPLNTDSFQTKKLWLTAAEQVAEEVKPVLTPMVPFGVEYEPIPTHYVKIAEERLFVTGKSEDADWNRNNVCRLS